MSEKIKAAVRELLNSANVEFSATLRGETRRGGGNEAAWICDEWQCEFSIRRNGARHLEWFAFFMGTGHRDKHGRPCAPTAADVLHSLILDASACEQNFGDWCADYGYSSDSVSALRTYHECQENARRLARVINRETLEALRELLSDY